MSIPTFTPATYTVAETGRYRTADGRDVYDITAGTVISMKQAIDLALPGAGYATISPLSTIEEERVEDIAVPLTGLEQRTDRHEPLDGRLFTASPIAFLSTNDVGLFHFRLAHDFTVAKLGVYFGATIAGNIALGIYTSNDLATFTRVASTAATAVTGSTNSVREFSLSQAYTCQAGVNYWFALGITDGTLQILWAAHRIGVGATQATSIYKASAYSSGVPSSITSVTGGAGVTPWFTLIA